jgi:pimeloyl-ACP methyl ester carboxylesterase
MPETRHLAVGNGVELAVQRFGDGPVDLVYVPGFVSHIELQWADAAYARYLSSLGKVARVTLYDKRGGGGSSPVHRAPTLEEHIADLGRVVDDASDRPVVVLGFSNGGAIAMSFAAAHPERVAGLVLCSSFARVEGFEDLTRAADEVAFGLMQRWGEGAALDLMSPSLAGSKLARRNVGLFERAALHPDMVRGLAAETRTWDITPVLPLISAPTLVLHRTNDAMVPLAASREVASRISGARFVELDGGDHLPYLGDATRVLVEVEAFIREVAGTPAPPRPVTTVLFTDLVGSTDHAVTAGDARWRAMREAHDDLTRAEVARHGGRAVKSTGDGWLAAFPEAPSAVRAASDVIQQVRRLGLEVRAGAHAGEVDVLDDGDLSGLTVHVAARVAAVGGPGEVVLTEAVRGRLASSVPLRPWGVAELKGVPGSWPLHALDGEVDPIEPSAADSSLAPRLGATDRVMVAVARRVIARRRARAHGLG